MKTTKLLTLIIVTAVLIFTGGMVQAQVYKGTSKGKISKGSVYLGTYQLPDGNISSFFAEKDKVYANEFTDKAEPIGMKTGMEVFDLLNTVQEKDNPHAISTNAKEISDDRGLKVMYARDSWGSLNVYNGLWVLNSDEKFVQGFEFQQEDKRKLKIEDSWRTAIIGSRTIVPENSRLFNFKAKNGKTVTYDLTGTPFIPTNGYIQVAGVINEKVSIKDPSPYNQNRLIVFKAGFDNTETSEVHIMPYSMRGIGVSTDAQNNMVVLTVPLYAPSTYAPHKALLAPDEEKNQLYIYRFDNNNNFIIAVR